MNEQFEPIFMKVILLGSQGTGKTSLISRFVADQFNQETTSTTLSDFFSIDTVIKEQPLKVQIWDTTEQEMFSSLHKSIYKNIDGILLCYDCTNRQSFQALQNYVDKIKKLDQKYSLCIVGTKSDLNDEREVERQEGEVFAHKYDYFFEEVSAKDNDKVKDIFETVLIDCMQQKRKNLLIEQDLISLKTGVLSQYSKKVNQKQKIDKKCW